MIILPLSFFDFVGESGNVADYIINKYSYEKIRDNHYFVSNIFGSWAVLNQKEFDLLRTDQPEKNPNLFNYLKNSGIILTADNQEALLRNIQTRNSFLFNSVNLHVISPTLRCNQKCTYCHARAVSMDAKGYNMDEEMAKNTVDFIFQSPSKIITIEFQGGEPLLAFDSLKLIVDYAKNVNEKRKKLLNFVIQTNFTKMNDEIATFLADNDFRIGTSLDGPKDIHDKNRKYLDGSGTYKDVVKWIKILKSQYDLPINALPTITKLSLNHHKEIVDEYKSLGIMQIFSRPLLNTGMNESLWKSISFTSEEYIHFWKNMLEYIMKLNRSGVNFSEYSATILAKKFLSNNYIGYTCWGCPCGAALSQVGYDHEGNIYMCDESRSFGDIS